MTKPARDELAELPLEVRIKYYDEGMKALIARNTESFKTAASASVEYGKASIRSLFLLNGAAPIALLSFLAALYRQDTTGIKISAFLSAFLVFAVGLVMAVVCSTLAYLNFMYQQHDHMQFRDLNGWIGFLSEPAPESTRIITATFILALLCGLASLLCFILGVLLVAKGLAQL